MRRVFKIRRRNEQAPWKAVDTRFDARRGPIERSSHLAVVHEAARRLFASPLAQLLPLRRRRARA